MSTKTHQDNRPFFPGLEADGCSRRYIQAHSKGFFSVKSEGAVGFKKMEMRSDLNGAVSGICHGEFGRLPPGIRLDISICENVFSWYQCFLLANRVMYRD